LLFGAASAAGLIHSIDRRLLPAPTALRWLASSPREQRSTLRHALLYGDLARDNWTRWRWPGWRLLKDLPAFDAIMPPSAQSAQARVLVRRIVARADDMWITKTPASSIDALCAHLQRIVRLTGPPARPRGAQSKTLSLSVVFEESHGYPRTRNVSLRLSANARLELSSLLGTPVAHGGAYRINQATITYALASGRTIAAIIQIITTYAPGLLDSYATQALRRWASAHGALTLRDAVLLVARTPELLDVALRKRGVRACVERTLSPRVVVVKPGAAASLARKLKHEAGFAFSQLSPPWPASQHDAENAQLYLAARLIQSLDAPIPAALRSPQGLIDRLGGALPRRLRAEADAALADWQSSRASGRAQPKLLALGPAMPAALPPATLAIHDTLLGIIANQESVATRRH
jgi:hypothetical protein